MKKILCIFLLALFVSSGMQAQKKKSFWDRVNRAIDKTGRAIDKTLDVADELLGGSNSSSKPRPTAEVKVGDVLIQQYGNNQIFQFEYGGTYRQSHKPHDVYVAFRVTNLNEFDYDLYYEPYSNNTYSLIAIDEKGTKYTFDCAFEGGLDNKLYNNCEIPGENSKAVYFKFEEVSKYISKFDKVYLFFTPYRKGKYGDKFAIVLDNVDIEVIDTQTSTNGSTNSSSSNNSSNQSSSTSVITDFVPYTINEEGVEPIVLGMAFEDVPNSVKGLYSYKIKDIDEYGQLRGFYLSNTSNKKDAVLQVYAYDSYTDVLFISVLKSGIVIKNTNIQVGMPQSELVKIPGIKKDGEYQGRIDYLYKKDSRIRIFCKNKKVTEIFVGYEVE